GLRDLWLRLLLVLDAFLLCSGSRLLLRGAPLLGGLACRLPGLLLRGMLLLGGLSRLITRLALLLGPLLRCLAGLLLRSAVLLHRLARLIALGCPGIGLGANLLLPLLPRLDLGLDLAALLDL